MGAFASADGAPVPARAPIRGARGGSDHCIPLLLSLADVARVALGFGGNAGGLFPWIAGALVLLVVLRVGSMLAMASSRALPASRPTGRHPLRTPLGRPKPLPAGSRPRGVSPAARAREGSLRLGGGAYLGLDEHGGWVTADPESAVMILGPPARERPAQ